MRKAPNAPSAFQKRHAQLAAQLKNVKSASMTKQIQRAMFVSGVVAATIHDLQVVVQRASDELGRELAFNQEITKSAMARFEEAAATAAQADTDIDGHAAVFGAALARMEAEGAWYTADLATLKCRLLQTASLMWLELMEDFFESDDRRVLLGQFEKVASFGFSKIPIVGDAFEAAKTALEIFAARIKEAKDADAYMVSLESYVDAGNLYLNCALTFCESAERSLQGRAPATAEDLQSRVAAHIAAVGAGTHPTSALRGDA